MQLTKNPAAQTSDRKERRRFILTGQPILDSKDACARFAYEGECNFRFN